MDSCQLKENTVLIYEYVLDKSKARKDKNKGFKQVLLRLLAGYNIVSVIKIIFDNFPN